MRYRLTCQNNSRMHGSFAVYQSPPPTSSPGELITLAWMARPVAPGSQVTFSWETTLSFVWGEAGVLRAGSVFEASQAIAGDPFRENLVDLAQDGFGAPMFTNLRVGGPPGTMTINQLGCVFDYPVSVGIGMGDMPAYAVLSNPNVSTSFTPHLSEYWLVFGSYTGGEVLETETTSGALKLKFDAMNPKKQVSLDMDNILRSKDSR